MHHYAPGRTPVAIIGAGPYGLSVAAHLRACGVEFRIFGIPMHSWGVHMPSDMFLKSEGFASNLHTPEGYPLERFCVERGLPYKYMGLPVSREIFMAYGLEFQRRFVPNLEEKIVLALDRLPVGWQLSLHNGATVIAHKVVVAAGLSYFKYVPPVLAQLPSQFLSHSYDHSDMSMFKGRDVTVIGGGASACDVAASLHTAGAQVRLIVRQPTLSFTDLQRRPFLWGRLWPGAGLGGGWRDRFYETSQLLFRCLPEKDRLRIVRSHLGPRAHWPVKDIIVRLPPLLGQTPRSAEVQGRCARLVLMGKDGSQRDVLTDHIIAATGFRVDIGKLPFLDDDVCSEIRTAEDTPILSENFESSIPGLYFSGLAAANTFGPSMRFVVGARFAARRLARHFARSITVR
jgi:cation diffusion facilitator CzcD-associated flavoprotein CzcO